MNEVYLEGLLEQKQTVIYTKHAYFIIKRVFDVLISLIGCLFIIPIALVVKLSYVLTGDFSPIIFKHKRIGKDGKYIYLYKFRTMVKNAEDVLNELLKDPKYKKEWNANHKLDKDPRITKIGKILRKTSLDEIPQFINILKGDMSFVGPRPIVDGEIDIYGADKAKFLSVKPGLTGWWACNGRSCTNYKQRKKLELYYCDNCSIILDIKCIVLTILRLTDGAK